MVKVDLNIKELRALIHWTQEAIRDEEAKDWEYSETYADMLGGLEEKLEKALDQEMDRLVETIRRA